MATNVPGNVGELFFGKSPETSVQQQGLFTSEQQRLFSRLIEQLGSTGGPRQLSLAGLDEFTRNLASAGITDRDEAFFSANVEEPLTDRFKEDILPGISRRFAGGGGFYGSERIRADQAAVGELSESLTRGRTQFVTGQERFRSEQLLKALGLQGQLELGGFQAGLAPQQLLAQLLGIPQQENIGFATPGTEGLLQGLSGAAGVAGGTYAGLKLAGA